MEKKPRYQWLKEVLPNDIAAKVISNVILVSNADLLKRDCYKENTIIDAFVFMDAEEGYDYWKDIDETYFKIYPPKDYYIEDSTSV